MPEKISEVFSIAGECVDALAALDPFGATEMGVPGHGHRPRPHGARPSARYDAGGVLLNL